MSSEGAGATAANGNAYVVFGKSANANPIQLSAVAAGTGGFLIDGSGVTQGGGGLAGVGDVNGDGIGDILFGSPSVNSGAGAAYVVFGKSTDTSPIQLSGVPGGTSSSGFAINGVASSGFAGTSVAGLGDLNGDGLGDLLVGAPGSSGQAGAAYVVFGKSADTSPIPLSDVAVGSGGFVVNGAASNDRLGQSVASAGDINRDGVTDLLLGAPGAVSGVGKGAAYVVFGKTSASPIGPIDLASFNTAGVDGFVVSNNSVAVDGLGFAVAGAGDLNGDGVSDVLVSAPSTNPSTGKVYAVFSPLLDNNVLADALSALDTTAATVTGDVKTGSSAITAGILGADRSSASSGLQNTDLRLGSDGGVVAAVSATSASRGSTVTGVSTVANASTAVGIANVNLVLGDNAKVDVATASRDVLDSAAVTGNASASAVTITTGIANAALNIGNNGSVNAVASAVNTVASKVVAGSASSNASADAIAISNTPIVIAGNGSLNVSASLTSSVGVIT